MKAVKIACLGGGSLYFTGALANLLVMEKAAGSEIILYDLDDEKSKRMAAMGQRLAEKAGTGFRVRAARRLSDAIDGADFAVASIGGSGAEITPTVYGSSFHSADVRIPMKYGICQIVGDTCGPAGMMMALRSIPPLLSLCREMEKRCPRVILFNHSNPMAVLCRALHKYAGITAIGICHGVQSGITSAARLLNVPPTELECLWIGTNHYYWFTRLLHRGRDVYPELMRRVSAQPNRKGSRFSTALSQVYGYRMVYAADDHVIEFYPFLTQASGRPERLPYGLAGAHRSFAGQHAAKGSRRRLPVAAERAAFFKRYQELLDQAKLPEPNEGEGMGEGLGGMISAMANGHRHICIANIANRGTIPNLPPTAEVEVEAVTDSRGVRPIHMGNAPLVLKGILEKRFVWQELVADAAVKGDRHLALQALLTDELAIWPDKAEAMLNELLAASKALLPQFEHKAGAHSSGAGYAPGGPGPFFASG